MGIRWRKSPLTWACQCQHLQLSFILTPWMAAGWKLAKGPLQQIMTCMMTTVWNISWCLERSESRVEKNSAPVGLRLCGYAGVRGRSVGGYVDGYGMGVLGGHVDGWPERGIFRPKVSAHLETNCRLNRKMGGIWSGLIRERAIARSNNGGLSDLLVTASDPNEHDRKRKRNPCTLNSKLPFCEEVSCQTLQTSPKHLWQHLLNHMGCFHHFCVIGNFNTMCLLQKNKWF